VINFLPAVALADQLAQPRSEALVKKLVGHYRGDPHFHVWVNVASEPSVKITTA